VPPACSECEGEELRYVALLPAPVAYEGNRVDKARSVTSCTTTGSTDTGSTAVPAVRCRSARSEPAAIILLGLINIIAAGPLRIAPCFGSLWEPTSPALPSSSSVPSSCRCRRCSPAAAFRGGGDADGHTSSSLPGLPGPAIRSFQPRSARSDAFCFRVAKLLQLINEVSRDPSVAGVQRFPKECEKAFHSPRSRGCVWVRGRHRLSVGEW
jgi:hypothetical protein